MKPSVQVDRALDQICRISREEGGGEAAEQGWQEGRMCDCLGESWRTVEQYQHSTQYPSHTVLTVQASEDLARNSLPRRIN